MQPNSSSKHRGRRRLVTGSRSPARQGLLLAVVLALVAASSRVAAWRAPIRALERPPLGGFGGSGGRSSAAAMGGSRRAAAAAGGPFSAVGGLGALEPSTRGSARGRGGRAATRMLLGFGGGKAAQPVAQKGLGALIWDPLRRAAELFPFTKGLIDQGWTMLPLALRALINPQDLLLFITTRLLYRKFCRALHAFHHFLWKRVGILDEPNPYEDSVLGFVEPKLGTLTSLLGITYAINVAISLLVDIGWRVREDSARLLASLLYIAYGAFFLNEVKKQYLPAWVPSLQEDKRRSYIIDRSSSVVLWILAIFSCIECISAFLKVPLSSTLAFGGIGGLAFGLASKDVVSNFFGGLMLLFTEPFTPGDMVSFTTRGTHYEGKVERVGWYQTRLRGRDTRPTYVPNSVFVDTMVTNMDRITHRRFEASFSLRYQDFETLPEVILEIKKALRVLPKVDVLSPFRVHFTTFGPYCLNLQASCYFATKSLDEFLYLQQLALMEITRVVTECGCRLAFPTTHVDLAPRELGEALVTGVVDYQTNLESVGGMAPGGMGGMAGMAGAPPGAAGPPPPAGPMGPDFANVRAASIYGQPPPTAQAPPPPPPTGPPPPPPPPASAAGPQPYHHQQPPPPQQQQPQPRTVRVVQRAPPGEYYDDDDIMPGPPPPPPPPPPSSAGANPIPPPFTPPPPPPQPQPQQQPPLTPTVPYTEVVKPAVVG